MPEMNIVQAVNSALDIMLEKDPDVIFFGEDAGYFGGVFRTSDGLQEKHGKHRVFDTPLSEGGIAAIAFGMGINGCLLYTSPSPRDKRQSRMPSSA